MLRKLDWNGWLLVRKFQKPVYAIKLGKPGQTGKLVPLAEPRADWAFPIQMKSFSEFKTFGLPVLAGKVARFCLCLLSVA